MNLVARQVAELLTAKDALAAHTRDELGVSEATAAKPIQAAMMSAAMFTLGAALPLSVVPLVPRAWLSVAVALGALLGLGVLGAVGARAGRAPVGRSVLRVTFWGVAAMALTAGIGKLFGAII